MQIENSYDQHQIIDVTHLNTEESQNFGPIKATLTNLQTALLKQANQTKQFLDCLLQDLQNLKSTIAQPDESFNVEFSIARFFVTSKLDHSEDLYKNKANKVKDRGFIDMLRHYADMLNAELYDIRDQLAKPILTTMQKEKSNKTSKLIETKDSFEEKQIEIKIDEKQIHENLEATRSIIKMSLGDQSSISKPPYNPMEEIIHQSKKAVRSRIMEVDPHLRNTDIDLLRKDIESLKTMLKNQHAFNAPIDAFETNDINDFQTSNFMKDLMKHIQFQKDDLGDNLNPQTFNKILGRKLLRLFNGYEYEENLYSCKSIMKVFYLSVTDFVIVFLDFVQLVSLFVNKINQTDLRQAVKDKILDFCYEQVHRHSLFAETIQNKQNEYFTDIKEVTELAKDYNKTFKEFTDNNCALVKEIREILVKDNGSGPGDNGNGIESVSKLTYL